MTKLALVLSSACFLSACSGEDSGPRVDVDGDVFGQDADGKGDQPVGGIRENTFDAFGVLNAAAQLDAAGWRTVTGVSRAKANKLVEAQKSSGWGTVGLPSLRALNSLGVTDAQIEKLRVYAEKHELMPKAALKIPVQNSEGKYLTDINGRMDDAGLPLFSKNMYSWPGAAGTGQYAYFSELVDRASEHDIDADLTTGASLYVGDGTAHPCYLGSRIAAVSAVEVGLGVIWSEQMMIWGWRAGTKKVLDEVEESDLLMALDAADKKAWLDYDTSSNTVMIASTVSDGGDDPSLELVESCP